MKTAPYWCVAALAMAAAFKVVTAILMTPVVMFAWTRVLPTRRRTAALVAIALVAAPWPGSSSAQPAVDRLAFAQSSRWLFRRPRSSHADVQSQSP